MTEIVCGILCKKEVNKHSCLDCKYIDIMPSEPLSTRFDCLYPKWEDGHNEYYWNAWEENDCDYFKQR